MLSKENIVLNMGEVFFLSECYNNSNEENHMEKMGILKLLSLSQ